MNDIKIVEAEPAFSDMLVKVGSSALIGYSKKQVWETWKPLLTTGAFLLTEGENFMYLRSVETGETPLRADFLNGRCTGQTLEITNEQVENCLAEIKMQGFRYKSTSGRWTKQQTPYTWRSQRFEENTHLVTCRRLLTPKVSKSSQNH